MRDYETVADALADVLRAIGGIHYALASHEKRLRSLEGRASIQTGYDLRAWEAIGDRLADCERAIGIIPDQNDPDDMPEPDPLAIGVERGCVK